MSVSICATVSSVATSSPTALGHALPQNTPPGGWLATLHAPTGAVVRGGSTPAAVRCMSADESTLITGGDEAQVKRPKRWSKKRPPPQPAELSAEAIEAIGRMMNAPSSESRQMGLRAVLYLARSDAERAAFVDAGIAPDDFAKRFERRSEPCLVTNVPEREGWALRNWTSINGRPTNRGDLDVFRMKVGEDDDGKTVRVCLRDFVSYARFNRDDSPLYVFDQAFCEKHGRDFYSIPKFCARDDLFELVGEVRRPPYQWFLLGPQRSGTCVHIDPLGTSAWNALLSGAVPPPVAAEPLYEALGRGLARRLSQ